MAKYKRVTHGFKQAFVVAAFLIPLAASVAPYVLHAQVTGGSSGGSQSSSHSASMSSSRSPSSSSSRSSSLSSSIHDCFCPNGTWNPSCSPTFCPSSSRSSSSIASYQYQYPHDLSVILDTDRDIVAPGANVIFSFKAKNGGNSGPRELATIRMRLAGMEYVENSNCTAVSYGGISDEIECNVLIAPGETKLATLTLKAPAAACPYHSVYNSRFAYIASNNITEQALQNNVSNIVNTIIGCD